QIEQGQSGGPVLDRHGRAVGVVTWTWRDQKGGFAIPITEAARMLAERPRLDSEAARHSRAEERVRAYVAALGTGSQDELRRLTSPSHAREVRGRTVEVLLERSTEESILQSFLTGIDQLLLETASDSSSDPFPVFERMVARTGTDEFMGDLGVRGKMSGETVQTFFFEIGSAYMAARLFGDYGRRDAMLVAYQRVYSLDAARSMALLDSVDGLRGVNAELQGVEVSPGIHAPRAVATVDIGRGRRIAVQMRMEWGDWYISEVQQMSL
ncbi:MAG: hypothetical protein KC431_29225, partial [Myxococcales bacterium]|nr:hypothetical protein [Myxococcales bacterium]